MDPNRPVVLAVITGAHGVGGTVKLKLFTDDLTRYRSFNGGALRLASLNGLLARFDGVSDRNSAERLRGTTLTVLRSELPPLAPGEYYHFDLIDLSVVAADGGHIGRVVAVENFGAGDVIEIEKADGKRFMMAMSAVTDWDERITIDPLFIV
jgi:16S rRNA processing protein RimM